MERRKKIKHKGKTIYYFDWKSLKGEDLYNTIKASKERLNDAVGSGRKGFLVIVDTTDTVISIDLLKRLQEGMKFAEHYIKGVALVGMSGLNTFFIELSSKITDLNIKMFDSVDDAKEWLISL